MIHKRGQQEMEKILVVAVLAVVAAILLLYFGYTWFKSQTTSFEQSSKPNINPIPLIAIPAGGMLLKKFWRDRSGTAAIIGTIWDILQVIVIILVAVVIISLMLPQNAGPVLACT
jgi:uncharacterized protein (UPF0333 family)